MPATPWCMYVCVKAMPGGAKCSQSVYLCMRTCVQRGVHTCAGGSAAPSHLVITVCCAARPCLLQHAVQPCDWPCAQEAHREGIVAGSKAQGAQQDQHLLVAVVAGLVAGLFWVCRGGARCGQGCRVQVRQSSKPGTSMHSVRP